MQSASRSPVASLLIATGFVMLATSCSTTRDLRPPSARAGAGGAPRARARELGVVPGILPPGRWNAITDVSGVKVGHTTLVRGSGVRTGVTVIVPHEGELFREKVPAAVCVANGFGKAVGFTQIQELGEIETPIALTNTLNSFRVADALVSLMLERPGMEGVRSINPVVGETNDGFLNDIRGRHVSTLHVRKALEAAASGAVAEGCVGAGTGTRCLGFKGGIGTSSRVIPTALGGYTLGVLVQTNFGGILAINGAPVGRELRRHYLSAPRFRRVGGSCMIIIATDAPLSPRNLERLAKRAHLAFGRVGAFEANGSGDYSIAFSTHPGVRRGAALQDGVRQIADLANDRLSPLFLACVEATEEAIYNSMFMANDTTGFRGHKAEALPIKQVLEILRRYKALNQDKTLPSGLD